MSLPQIKPSPFAAGELFHFLSDKDEETMALISRKILHRPADCLLNLKKYLAEKMIRHENDDRPRKWRADSHISLIYQAARGVTQLHFSNTSPQGMPGLLDS